MKENNTQQQESANKSMGASWEGGEGEGMAMMPPKFGVTAGRGDSHSKGNGNKKHLDTQKQVKYGTFSMVFESRPIQENGLEIMTNVIIRFFPNAECPDSERIILVQVAANRSPENGMKPGWDSDSGNELKKASIKGEAKSYRANKGDNFSTISIQQTNGHVSPDEIANFNNRNVFETLNEGELINIPQKLEGSHVDFGRNPNFYQPRSNKSQPNFSKAFAVDSNEGKEKIGYKKGEKIKSASIHDTPNSNANTQLIFETVAMGEDIGVEFATLHWGFSINEGIISGAFAYVAEGVSDNFKASVVAFNKHLKNEHLVVKGDTWESISMEYFGTPNRADKIQQANPNYSAELVPGSEIIIPGVSAK